jgi:hypothetical protein
MKLQVLVFEQAKGRMHLWQVRCWKVKQARFCTTDDYFETYEYILHGHIG